QWRNRPALGGMNGRLQRFIRSHPFWAPEWIQRKFPKCSLERIEAEQAANYAAWTAGLYREDGTDYQAHDGEGEYSQFARATEFDVQRAAAASQWSRRAAAPQRLLEGLKTERRQSPYPRPVVERSEPRTQFPVLWGGELPKDWRPQSGFVNEDFP